MKVHLATHRGHNREENFDCGWFDLAKGWAVIADGLNPDCGGRAGATTAVEAIKEFLATHYRTYPDLRALIPEAIQYAHRHLLDRSTELGAPLMASLTLAMVERGKLHFGWVGNCRLYHLRGIDFTRLTRDHSVAEADRAAGKDSARAGDTFSLLQVLGQHEVRLEMGEPLPLREGDLLILCTDGVFKELTESEIGELALRHGPSPRQVAEALELSALRHGGRDNITTIPLLFEAEDLRGANVHHLPRKASETLLDQEERHYTLSLQRCFFFGGLLLLGAAILVALFSKSRKASPNGSRTNK